MTRTSTKPTSARSAASSSVLYALKTRSWTSWATSSPSCQRQTWISRVPRRSFGSSAGGVPTALVRARHVDRPGGWSPPPPPRRVGVGDLVVDDERAAGLEVGEHPGQPSAVLISGDAQSEAAAAHDRSVATGQVELVVGLGDERRRRADGGGRLAAELEHVDRHVRAVDVESIADVGHEQATGAAGEVEGRWRGGDVAAEEVDLGPVQVEERPPARHQAVVPRRRGRRALVPHVHRARR